jgi:hypothetical protein
MSAAIRAEIKCYDPQGRLSAIAVVGENEIEQVFGDCRDVREVIALAARDIGMVDAPTV